MWCRSWEPACWSGCIKPKLRRTPDVFRRHLVELRHVQCERRIVLLLEHARLLLHREQLGVMVELVLQHVATELAVSPAEQQMLVPDLIDHPGRRDGWPAHDTEVEKLLVLSDHAMREAAAPPELPCELAFEGLGRCIGPTKSRRDAVDEVRWDQVVEMIVLQAAP